MLSLLPLLCAVLLLLSACQSGRDIVPPTDTGASGTNSGGTTSANVDGGTSDETKPLPVLQEKDLNGTERNTLNTLKYTVSNSKRLQNLDSQDFETVLSNAEQWLKELQKQTDDLKDTLRKNHSNSDAPGLENLSTRLAQMLQVITTNQGTAP